MAFTRRWHWHFGAKRRDCGGAILVIVEVRPGRRRGLLERWKVGLVSDPNQGRVVSVPLGFDQPAPEWCQLSNSAVHLRWCVDRG